MRTPTEMHRLRGANPFPATRIKNEVLFAGIVTTPGDSRLAPRSRTTRRPSGRGLLGQRTILVAVAALVIGAGSAAAVVSWSIFAPTEGQLEAERGGTFLPETFRILRTLDGPAGTTWTVVTYKTTKYECLDVYAAFTGSAEPAGAVGGCGLPPFSDQQVIQGGAGGSLRVGTNLFSLSGGRAAPQVATVQATFADGSTAVDHPVGGIWLFVSSADRSALVVEAFDDRGEVLGRLPLTPLGQ